MALTSTERSRIRRAEMDANDEKELRGMVVPKSIDMPTERELKTKLARAVKFFLKQKGDL